MNEFDLTITTPSYVAMEKVRDALLSGHSGIANDIDVPNTFGNKMSMGERAYHIPGACNPEPTDRADIPEPRAVTGKARDADGQDGKTG